MNMSSGLKSMFFQRSAQESLHSSIPELDEEINVHGYEFRYLLLHNISELYQHNLKHANAEDSKNRSKAY